ncbi:hypothetical protein HHL22_04560 [Hymenobacter sp. RP-2-7]|uniref:Clp R domain-containing protein n=1 Tax=Hymenobacter polaris TaxID=2682546 RepID=A0A7Y0FLG6_9BACT|nr:Clp protease N-terminal domain-containing protein [Hymenobacter polaris]NML64470.1 hypothetical protein [Hymenobacter polaris]
MASVRFSVEMQRVIAESRQVALHLGCDYVSTLHLLLADCQLYPFWSLRDVLFGNARALTAFTEQLRAGPPLAAAGSLPLLKECERALRKTKTVARHYRAAEVLPCHFLLAAAQVPSSLLATLLAENQVSISTLMQHFERTGQLGAPAAAGRSFWLAKVRHWLAG